MAVKVEGVCTLLGVFDMRKSIAFYRDVLGFEVVKTSRPGNDFDWALLRVGDVELMLNTLFEAHERPRDPDPVREAAHGDTSLFLGCRDLEGAYEQLRIHGIEVKAPIIRAYGMKQLWLTDPDGYTVCLQWPA